MSLARIHSSAQLGRQTGMSLIEVLVALAIVAVAIGALTEAITGAASMSSHRQERTAAHWVAMNVIAEAQLEKNWPNTGTTRGTQKMMQHDWSWVRIVHKTSEPDLRRVEVEVRNKADDPAPLLTLNGFVAKKEEAR